MALLTPPMAMLKPLGRINQLLFKAIGVQPGQSYGGFRQLCIFVSASAVYPSAETQIPRHRRKIRNDLYKNEIAKLAKVIFIRLLFPFIPPSPRRAHCPYLSALNTHNRSVSMF